MHGLSDALLGTLFTWFLTAVGAACVLFVPRNRRDILDSSLGFSGGVMLAASYWSLLEPALSLAEDQGWASMSCVPVGAGLVGGAAFVLAADLCLPDNVVEMITSGTDANEHTDTQEECCPSKFENSSQSNSSSNPNTGLRQRIVNNENTNNNSSTMETSPNSDTNSSNSRSNTQQLRRLILLIIAITVHNFPEGLAVGVAYASVGRPGVDIQQAHNLALGIGLQNFPEGLAVSVPLKAAGYSTLSSFFWGQASGMVEPLAGLLGVLCVTMVERLLPVALAFAAGAMIWVVCNDIVPECTANGNSKLCSVGVIIGFVVMMSLDTALA